LAKARKLQCLYFWTWQGTRKQELPHCYKVPGLYIVSLSLNRSQRFGNYNCIHGNDQRSKSQLIISPFGVSNCV